MTKYVRQILMMVFAISIIAALQYQFWFGDHGYRDSLGLKKQIEEQQFLNDKQKQENKALYADVLDLKNGLDAVEEHARADLGLIKAGETFIQMSTAHHIFDNSKADFIQNQTMPSAE